ncbi:hypothetical protein FHY10_000153 [Xanthomonas arboricola]|nr:hypothetical protein [Xanthomonas arboricola]
MLIAQISMPPAITDRQMSWITRAFSTYIQLRRWATASSPICSASRALSRSRAVNALIVHTVDTASTSSPPTRAAFRLAKQARRALRAAAALDSVTA